MGSRLEIRVLALVGVLFSAAPTWGQQLTRRDMLASGTILNEYRRCAYEVADLKLSLIAADERIEKLEAEAKELKHEVQELLEADDG